MAVGATTFGGQQLRVTQAMGERPETLWACGRNSCKTTTVYRHPGYLDRRRDAQGMARYLILDRAQYLEQPSHTT
jgi:hypothetical protein